MNGGVSIKNKGFLSGIITIIVVLLILFSGPAGAVTVEISGLSGSITKGDSKTYYLEVNIDNPDTQIPIDNLTLKISGSTNKNVVFVPNGTAISGGGDWITITSQNTNYTAYGNGSGYGVDNGYGYDFGIGYGYGYGQNYTKLRYKVVMETSDLDAGSYTATLYVYTGSSTHPAFTSSEASFEIEAASSGSTVTGGGGGGGGGGGTPPSEIKTDSEGKVESTFTEVSSGGEAKITIPKGTKALDASGNPLGSVSIAPATPIGGTIAMYDLKPDGATFDPPITFTVNYNPKDVPEGKEIVIKMYDGTKWIELETTIDPVKHTATAKVSSFSIFALFTEERSPTGSGPITSIEPTIVSVTPIPTTPPETVEPDEEGGINWPLLLIMVITAAIVILLAYYYSHQNNNNGF